MQYPDKIDWYFKHSNFENIQMHRSNFAILSVTPFTVCNHFNIFQHIHSYWVCSARLQQKQTKTASLRRRNEILYAI